MHLKENEGGDIAADMKKVEIEENELEKRMSRDELRLIQDMAHRSCPSYKESQVLVKDQLGIYRCKVWVQGRDCSKRKAPFASAGIQGENLFNDFTEELKRLVSMRGCGGTVEFRGIVFDDTGKHVMGYLYELPIIQNIRLFISLANIMSVRILWHIWELWARQIIAVVSNIHARGFILGALNNNQIGIRADGNVVLDVSESTHKRLSTQRDRLPSELHGMGFKSGVVSSGIPLNFQTDIFQLGLSIWLIAEHQPETFYLLLQKLCLATSAQRIIHSL